MKNVITHCLITMNGPLDVAEQILNAFVIAGIAFFAALGATILNGGIGYPPDPSVVYTGVLAGGLTFFVQWAYERGIKISPRLDEMLGRK